MTDKWGAGDPACTPDAIKEKTVTTSSPNPILKVTGLTKTFPGVTALDQVSLEVGCAEIHALLGENGAGKSTLLKILSGAQPADRGEISLFGTPLQVETPLESRQAGIVTIYQEFSLIPPLSVAENIYLGREPRGAFGIRHAQMHRDAKEALDRIGLNVSPSRLVSSLSVAEQQMVEIARALSFDSKLIIMDEPTAALSGSEVDRLLEIVLELKRQGISVIYVTHRLGEVFRVCDRYSVLRDGQLVDVGDVAEIDEDGLIHSMVGREFSHIFAKRTGNSGGSVALEARNLTSIPNLRDPNATMVRGVSLQANYGEILGIAGLVGAGRTETVRMLFGADNRQSGEILIDGNAADIANPGQAIAAGLGLVTEDRKKQGCFLDLPVNQNISMASLGELSGRFGQLDLGSENRLFEESRDRLDIKVSGARQAIGKLSGGNQQKALIARWLAKAPKILIVDEPTRGIDVRSKAQVHDILFDLADRGTAVIVISSELPEILTVSDRILTMSEGRITGEFSRETATEEKLMQSMTPVHTHSQDKPQPAGALYE